MNPRALRLAMLAVATVLFTSVLSFGQATVVSISVSPISANVPKGKLQNYKAVAKMSNGTSVYVTNLATWASSNGNAVVQGGATGATSGTTASTYQKAVLAAASSGTAVISATYGGKTGSSTMTLLPAVATSITVAPTPASIAVGATQQFNATIIYSDATTKDSTQGANSLVSWSSSATTIATINNSTTPLPGLATGKANGTATISATLGAVRGTAALTVGTPVSNPRLLTVTVTGSAGGRISSSPAGISCGNDGTTSGTICANNFSLNSTVTLTRTPISGGTFVGWGGACTGTATTCNVLMSAAKTVTASFKVPLTVSKSGNGTGTVTSSPTGINCGTDCGEAYAPTVTTVLTATPSANSTFVGWTGACTNTTGTCSVLMNQVRNVTANFALKQFTLTVNRTGLGSGSITSNVTGANEGIDCPDICVDSFGSGTVVVLTAAPDPGSTLGSWSGCSSASNPCTLTMTANRTASVSFSKSAPDLASPGAQAVNALSELLFTLSASDTDFDESFTYTSSDLPDGATLDADTGEFAWTPTFDQVGSHVVNFTVTDAGGLTDSIAVTITVNGLVSLELSTDQPNPQAASLFNGGTTQLGALGTFADSSTIDVTDIVLYSSSDSNVAGVDAAGLVTGGVGGFAEVMGALGGYSDTVAISTAVVAGGAGNQTGLGVTAGDGFVSYSGWSDTPAALLSGYSTPTMGTQFAFADPGDNQYSDVTHIGNTLYAVGVGTPPFCGSADTSDPPDTKAVFGAWDPSGTTILPCISYSFDPYEGAEGFETAAGNEESGIAYVYAAGVIETSASNRDVLVAKLAGSDGSVDASYISDGAALEASRDIAVLNNSVYVVGFANNGTSHPFILKVDNQLVHQWREDVGDVAGQFYGVAPLDGNVYVVGYQLDDVNGDREFLIEKYDSDGNRTYSVVLAHGPANDVLEGIAVGPENRLFVTGSTNDPLSGTDVVVMEIDPSDGAVISTLTLDSGGNETVHDIAFDGDNLYITGSTDVLGDSEAFVLRYTP